MDKCGGGMGMSRRSMEWKKLLSAQIVKISKFLGWGLAQRKHGQSSEGVGAFAKLVKTCLVALKYRQAAMNVDLNLWETGRLARVPGRLASISVFAGFMQGRANRARITYLPRYSSVPG